MKEFKSKCSSWSIGTFLFVLYSCFSISGQSLPETLWVPVTYYDFHSDGSNPEFEQHIFSGVRKGMVQDTLGAEKKPIVTNITKNINRNAYIKNWFRSWVKGNFNYPTYDDNGDGVWGAYLGDEIAEHDTSFINIVIDDSLPFTLTK
ncbi:MAG: hypothetical protein Q4F84_06370, partial [Fibrobacter sp.]|nr:hypothetical protein [Fibrobacter sp.]